MRAVLALTLSLGATAQYRYANPYAVPYAASPVHVAPAAAFSPYALRAPVRAVKPALPAIKIQTPVVEPPEVKAPVETEPVNLKADPQHARDYALWEDSYLNMKSADSTALESSPVFSWNYAVGTKQANWVTNNQDTLDALSLQGKTIDYNLAKRKMRRAVEDGADDKTLKSLGHRLNEKKYKYLEKAFKVNNIGNSGSIDTSYLSFFAQREKYLRQSDGYMSVMDNPVSTDADKASAAEDMKYNTWDLISKIPSKLNFVNTDDSFWKMTDIMSAARDLKSARNDYDSAIADYEKDASTANFYAAEIAELYLEQNEGNYAKELAGHIDALGGLMGGNYANALGYKADMIDAKIAELEEKIEAEKYLNKYGSYPYGRRQERPNHNMQQRLYYNLLN